MTSARQAISTGLRKRICSCSTLGSVTPRQGDCASTPAVPWIASRPRSSWRRVCRADWKARSWGGRPATQEHAPLLDRRGSQGGGRGRHGRHPSWDTGQAEVRRLLVVLLSCAAGGDGGLGGHAGDSVAAVTGSDELGLGRPGPSSEERLGGVEGGGRLD